jgi:hypothetical protein
MMMVDIDDIDEDDLPDPGSLMGSYSNMGGSNSSLG